MNAQLEAARERLKKNGKNGKKRKASDEDEREEEQRRERERESKERRTSIENTVAGLVELGQQSEKKQTENHSLMMAQMQLMMQQPKNNQTTVASPPKDKIARFFRNLEANYREADEEVQKQAKKDYLLPLDTLLKESGGI